MYLLSERAESMDEEENSQMDMSVRTAASDSWGGYRIPRGADSGQRRGESEERGRLSLAESAGAVAARIAGKFVN
jgi:hypothetical protein